jgi:hypothetical protein
MSEQTDGWDGFDGTEEHLAPGDDGADSFADFDGLEETEPAPDPGDSPSDVDASPDGAGQPVRPVTGNPRVDAATSVLDRLDDLPTPEHADVFDDVHRGLQGALADLDEG